jgi:hypothetical protein
MEANKMSNGIVGVVLQVGRSAGLDLGAVEQVLS